jgi:TrmH family RNA methyltransferase
LTNAEITRCHYLIHIPTSPDYPALNLGQAAAICLYEFHQASRGHQPPEGMPGEAPAAFGELEQMYQHLAKALNEIHFLHGEKAGSLMHGVRHLIGRAQPTATEVGLLHGLARQIEWYVSRYRGGATAR